MGCSGDAGPTSTTTLLASEDCRLAFQAWTSMADTAELADRAAASTLTACANDGEWLGEARRQPEALGHDDGADVGSDDLAAACAELDPEGEAPACG